MRFTVSSWNKLPVTRALKREHLNWWMHITVPIPQAANYSCFTAAPIYICHKNLQQKLYCRSSIIIFTAPLKFCLKTPQKVAALQNFIFYSSSPPVHVTLTLWWMETFCTLQHRPKSRYLNKKSASYNVESGTTVVKEKEWEAGMQYCKMLYIVNCTYLVCILYFIHF